MESPERLLVPRKKQLWFLVLVLLVTGVIVLGLFSRFKASSAKVQKNAPLIAVVTPKEQTPATRSVQLKIQPANQIIRPLQPIQLDVLVENNTVPISSISLNILYDKDFLTLNTPTLGNFFSNPIVFENSVDNKNGLLTVSLGSTTAGTVSGVVIQITGTVNSGTSGETDLVILPQSKVIPQGSTSSILTQTGQATLNILLF